MATFLDPTVAISGDPGRVSIKEKSYIAPFAVISASGLVSIGKGSNLQDNVAVYGAGDVSVGDDVSLAHGAQVKAPAKIGGAAVAGGHYASFVGFNSLIDGATLEPDAMVLHLSRVAPGIVVRSGKVVLSGKNVTTQAQADDVAQGKVIPISEALRVFMEGVLHVNHSFASGYTQMFMDNPTNVSGINYDPGNSDFNPRRNLPTFDDDDDDGGVRMPGYRNRIIGDIRLGDSLETVVFDTSRFGNFISLRADEGEWFELGEVGRVSDRTTLHALEHTGVSVGDGVRLGERSIIHGGSGPATEGNPHANTVVGSDASIGRYAVVFRSVLGSKVQVGCGSLVQDASLPSGTVIPRLTIVEGASRRAAEWNPGGC